MFYVLYDKDLKSIGETYILESWSRTQRATDFDEIKVIGEQIPDFSNPFLVVANDRQGKQMFSGLASTPELDEKNKKTTIALKDYMTLFNSEIIVNWSKFNGTTASDLLDFVLGLFTEQISTGLQVIEYDTTRLTGVILDTSIPLSTETIENVVAYDLISDAINYYNLYCIPKLDLKAKKLTYVFYLAGVNTLSIKLSDFGLNAIEKSFGDFNRASVYSSKFEKNQEWALTETNEVVKLPSDKKLIYPAKNKNFIAEEHDAEKGETETDKLYDAVYDAVMSLAGNRYQQNIELNAQQFKTLIDLTAVDFSYKFKVTMSDNTQIEIPVGEIETDSKGTHIIRLGYRVQELTQIL